MEPNKFLENALADAKNFKQFKISNLPEDVIQNTDILVSHEETFKGVFTAYLTSLTYKYLHQDQDIRYHKIDLPNGYSGRSFDTKYVTPFLKKNHFAGAMKESGWLTRSIEQNAPFDFNFPGKIQSETVKVAFLKNLDYLQKNPLSAYPMIYCLLNKSYFANLKRNVLIIKPIFKESEFQIPKLIGMFRDYFNYQFNSRGASILPVLAIYALYQCMMKEFIRYKECHLDILGSHNSCDRSSGEAGDIAVRKNISNDLYEVVEVKFNIKPTSLMILDVFKKIAQTNIQRYYILSTVDPDVTEWGDIDKGIQEISERHGCEIYVENIYSVIRETLEHFSNVNSFVDCFTTLLQNSTELNSEHKNVWNSIVQKNSKSLKIN